jgi:cation:H+ antiporter
MATGRTLGVAEAVLLIAALATYLAGAYYTESRGNQVAAAAIHREQAEAKAAHPRSWFIILGGLLGGLAVLIAGSRVLLWGAIGIARGAGLSEALIGLTLVAVGTSLPELTVSLLAAIRRQAGIAVGNILGSNIFNSLGILGAAGLFGPLAVAERILAVDQWVMHVATLALLVCLASGYRLNRLEGASLLTAYAVYVSASALLVG